MKRRTDFFHYEATAVFFGETGKRKRIRLTVHKMFQVSGEGKTVLECDREAAEALKTWVDKIHPFEPVCLLSVYRRKNQGDRRLLYMASEDRYTAKPSDTLDFTNETGKESK